MEFRSSFLCEAVSRRCDDGCMTSTTRIQRKYDHRLRELVRSTGAFVAYYGFSTGTPVDVAVAEKGEIRTYVEERAKTRLPEIYRVTMPLNGRNQQPPAEPVV